MKKYNQDYNIALSIAQEAHKNQLDKGGHPYILHLIRVSMCCHTNKAKIVALLHDILEDTDITPQDLLNNGVESDIVFVVQVLTRKPNESYHDYIERISIDDTAREVKIADLEDNMDITRLEALTDNVIKRLQKYHFYYHKLKNIVNVYK